MEHYRMYAYIFGRYADILRTSGSFDRLLEKYIVSAEKYGILQYFNEQLEHMVGRKEEYCSLYEQTAPVLIYMGDPICGDVLRIFSEEFRRCLLQRGVPVIMYDMAQLETTGLAGYFGQRFRAVLGFQTALFSVGYSLEREGLANNVIYGPKINFLYDHPLYLYAHFTYKLDRYYVLTQDADYADYINRCYPCIKRSYHLPPAGLELECTQKTAWRDKKYDIVFVASYHNYRERMLAIERECSEEYRDTTLALLDVMKDNPNLTCEAALERVLAANGGAALQMSAEDFSLTLHNCMDACRTVMFFYREKIIEILVNAGITIHVFGDTWNNCPLAGRRELVIHPDVSYIEGIRIMGQAKIAFNVMSWHKAGMTERIANAMLNGSVCVTDKTTVLEREFENGRDIVMFDLERLDELPGMIKNLLNDDERMQRIANAGYENASKNHRWKNRVDEFVRMLDEGMFE